MEEEVINDPVEQKSKSKKRLLLANYGIGICSSVVYDVLKRSLLLKNSP